MFRNINYSISTELFVNMLVQNISLSKYVMKFQTSGFPKTSYCSESAGVNIISRHNWYSWTSLRSMFWMIPKIYTSHLKFPAFVLSDSSKNQYIFVWNTFLNFHSKILQVLSRSLISKCYSAFSTFVDGLYLDSCSIYVYLWMSWRSMLWMIPKIYPQISVYFIRNTFLNFCSKILQVLSWSLGNKCYSGNPQTRGLVSCRQLFVIDN